MTHEQRLAALQHFQGSPQHEAILDTLRSMLTGAVASLLEPTWNAERQQAAHVRATTLLSMLIDLRLDKIDVEVLSQGAVSQIESLLPTRVQLSEQYLEGLRGKADSEV